MAAKNRADYEILTTSPTASSIARSVVLGELDPGGARVLLDLLGPARADDRRRDVRLAQHPRERELGHRQPGLRGDRLEALDRLEHLGSSRKRPIIPPMLSLAPRESAGGGASGRYLPVRTPWASGDQTICEMPFARAERDHLALGLAPEHRVLRLARDELLDAGQVERRLDLLRRSTR